MKKNELLKELLSDLADITNQVTNKEQAILKGKDKYLFIEFASNYGGYRIVNVNIVNGGHSGAFGGNGCEGRVNYKTMEVKLRALIAGVNYINKPLN